MSEARTDSKVTSATPTPLDALVSALQPMLARVAASGLDTRTSPADARALEEILEREFPFAGEQVRAVGQLVARGVADGWLCTRGESSARFSRVAKASDMTHGMSIDAVRLRGPALPHTHPRGEITLGFAVSGDAPQFEGAPPGWVVMGAGSSHTPEVVGGCMNLVYFLPGGAVKWHS
jgi:hypothetical protein